MANFRFDNLMMNRAAQAAGDVNSILLKQEVSPEDILAVTRRTGTVRQAYQAKSLGAMIEGLAMEACWFATSTLQMNASWSIGFSVKFGKLLRSNTSAESLPLITVRNIQDPDEAFELYSTWEGDLVMKSSHTTSATSSNGSARALDSTDSIVFQYDHSNDVLRVKTKGGETITLTGDRGVNTSEKFVIEILGHGNNSATPKLPHIPHKISNVTVYTSYLSDSDITALYENRSPSATNLKHHFKLSEGGRVEADAKSGSAHYLVTDPGKPEIVNSSYAFNGRSSALRFNLTPDMEQYFTVPSRSLFKTDYSIYFAGTVLKDPALGAQVLADLGDLGQLGVNTSNQLTFTVGGATVTFTSATISAGTAFTASAGILDSSGIQVRWVKLNTGAAATSNISTSYVAPELDIANPPKFYIGAEASESATTNFSGACTRFAFYDGYVDADVGAGQDALLYLTGEDFKDKSSKNTAVWPLVHSSISANPTYSVGPLSDGEHVSTVGGQILGEAGVIGLTRGVQRMIKKFKSDADALRIGDKLLIASNSVGHIVDETAETVREYGIPAPARDVSTKSSAPGVLEGAASYGYRFVTADGTYGPMRRLDPVAITSGTAGRFVLGSSSGGNAEFSETSGLTHKSTTEGMMANSGGESNPFTNNDEAAIEVLAKVGEYDIEEIKETVYDGSMQNAAASDPLHLSATTNMSGSLIDLTQNFTIQTSFRFGEHTTDRNSAVGIFGIGQTGGTAHHSTSAHVPEICAWLQVGANRPLIDDGPVYATNHHYGSTSDGASTTGAARLVLALSASPDGFSYTWRNKTGGSLGWDNTSHNYFAPFADYKILTFTNDQALWVNGREYTLYVVRNGDAVKVYVEDADAGTWTVLTGRSMDAVAAVADRNGSKTSEAYDAYNADTFFTDWSPKNLTTSFSVGSLSQHKTFVPWIEADGTSVRNVWSDYHNYNGNTDQGVGINAGHLLSVRDMYRNHSCYPFSYTADAGGTTNRWKAYCGRIWDEAKNPTLLEEYGSLTRSTEVDRELYLGLKSEATFFQNDFNFEDDTFNDRASLGLAWKTYAGSSISAAGYSNDVKDWENDKSHSNTIKQPILILGDTDNHTIANAPLALYFSSRAGGSLILQTASADGLDISSYVLQHDPISIDADVEFVKRFADYNTFVNEFDRWNMYTIGFKVANDGTYVITGLAINGNIIFNQAITEGVKIETADMDLDWVHLGGRIAATNNSTDCYIGEFRLWKNDKGPSQYFSGGTDGEWKVNSRLSPTEADDTDFYYKFNPEDLSSLELTNHGTFGSTLTFDSGVTLYDERTAGGTAVGFPQPPRTDLVAIEVFRTLTNPIADPIEDKQNIEGALDSVRYAPLYFLTRLTTGITSYVDDTQDKDLGFSAPYTDYSNPEDIKQFFTWQGQVGVLGERNTLYYTEPGPFGWETFPGNLVYKARIAGGGAGDLLACRSTGDTLYLFGRNWTTALIGSPGNETEFVIGGGVGAHSPRATIDITGIAYTFNGRLWAVDRVGQVDFKAQDIGSAFQDLLPTHSNVRLAASGNLQSLFIIDENTGDTIRLYLPTGQATVEKRDAISVTDNADGDDIWVHKGGSYSKGDTSVYGDDVQSDTPATHSGTITGASFNTGGTDLTTKVHKGMRVGIVDSAGATQDTTLTNVTSSALTVDAHDNIADGTVTMYFGASADGMLIDTGYIDSGNSVSMAHETTISAYQGTGIEIGMAGSPVVGSRSSISDAQFVTVAANEEIVRGDMRGRFVRCLLRNRKPEATGVSFLSMEINAPYE